MAYSNALKMSVLVAKYCDHLPLYRQSGIYAREGVELDRSTLAGWVGQCNALLRPLVVALQQHVLSGDKLHADDTPVPVLAPGEGKTKTGRLWTYVRDDRPAGQETPPAVWFAYSPNRRGEQSRRGVAALGCGGTDPCNRNDARRRCLNTASSARRLSPDAYARRAPADLLTPFCTRTETPAAAICHIVD